MSAGQSPLTVVHVSLARGFRGGEAQVTYLAEGLAAAGVRQVLVARRDAPLVERVRAFGMEVVGVGGRVGAASALRRLGLTLGGDRVAHAHDGHAHTACWLAALAGSRLDFVASRRVARAPRPGSWVYGKYRHPRLRALLCVSEAVASLHRAALGPGAPVLRVPDAVALPPPGEESGLRALLGVGPEVTLVGTVAALAPEKDVGTFVATCKLVGEALPRARFVHIGGGDDGAREELRELVALAGLGGRFHALGFRADATALLGELDAFLFTSRWEGLGSALLEAQARRVPVVTTDAGGTTEVVQDYESGRVGPVGASEVLAKAVLEILDDPARARLYTDTAFRRLDLFSRERLVERTLQAYGMAATPPN